MSAFRYQAVFVFLLIVVANTALTAGIPEIINIQGNLTNDLGEPLPDGTYSIEFRIFDLSSGGSTLWSSGDYVDVSLEGGLFNYRLGSHNPLPFSLGDSDSLWVELELDGFAPFSPRIRLASVMWSFRSVHTDTAAYAHAAGATGDCKWTVIDSILQTNSTWGLARGEVENMFYGDSLHTMVNFGVACTVGRDFSPGGEYWEYSTISGGLHHISTGSFAAIGGGRHNWTGALGATVAGGVDNVASNGWCAVGGGMENNSQGGWSTIGGGRVNWAFGDYSTIGGGRENYTMGPRHYSTVGGGHRNAALGQASTIGGGDMDTVRAHYGGIASGRLNHAGDEDADTAAFVGGGSDNKAMAMFSAIGGGLYNEIQGKQSVIAGGHYNLILGPNSSILGGQTNIIQFSSEYSTIGGGKNNNIFGGVGFIGGGDENQVHGGYSVVGGGRSNLTGNTYDFIGGGLENKTSGAYSTVSGGRQNVVDGYCSAILGGYRDTITESADYSYLFGIDSKLTEDSTFMVDMPHVHFGDESDGYEFPTSDGTNGQVMATDGNGMLNWTSMTSASGWTDDGSTVRLTNASDWVGIGTTTPGSRFHVENSGSGAAGLFVNNSPTDDAIAVYGSSHGPGKAVLGINHYSSVTGYLGGNTVAVYGNSSVGWAGYFYGNAHVSGRVGIGTENPQATLEVSGVARIQRSGWPTTGAGMELAYDSTINKGYIQVFDRNTQTWGDLYLGNGNVGINKINPQDKLEVKGNIRLDGGTGNGSTLRFGEGGTLKWALLYRPWASDKIGFHDEVNGRWVLMMDPNNDGRVGVNTPNPNYTLDVRGVIGNNTTVYHSDRRWKRNIQLITGALDKVNRLRGVYFEWNRDEFADMEFPAGDHIGIIAQEVEEVLPELVHTGSEGYKSVEYANLTALLIEAVKELKAENDDLKIRMAKLEGQQSR